MSAARTQLVLGLVLVIVAVVGMAVCYKTDTWLLFFFRATMMVYGLFNVLTALDDE